MHCYTTYVCFRSNFYSSEYHVYDIALRSWLVKVFRVKDIRMCEHREHLHQMNANEMKMIAIGVGLVPIRVDAQVLLCQTDFGQ